MQEVMQRVGLLTMLASPLTYPTVEHLVKQGLEDIVVVCEGDEPSAKVTKVLAARTGGEARFHRLLDYEVFGVPFFFVRNVNQSAALGLLERLQCRVMANCGVARKIDSAVLVAATFGVINCHPGSLPQYRGRNPVEWSLYNDDQVAATTHFMVEALDAGPIIKTAPLDCRGLTYHQIRARMLEHQAALMADSIAEVLERGAPMTDYPPQGEGNVFEAMPEELIAELARRRF